MGRAFLVFLSGIRAGSLWERPDGRVAFRFLESYLNLPHRPILSQSFEDDLERTYVSRAAGKLPPFFANLVHEGKLRSILARTFLVPEHDDLSLLEVAANDLPGAVTLLRDVDAGLAPETGKSELLEEEAKHGDGPNVGLRFSLAGVQLKFSMLREDERFLLPGHDQRGSWIVKPGSEGIAGLVENEWSMLAWARAAGMAVPEAEIVEHDALKDLMPFIPQGMGALAVKRYDRDGSRRIHQEDFAQVLGRMPDRKYDGTAEEMVVVARALLGDEGYAEAIRRLVFVVVCGNHDAHLKNWSLLYPDGVIPQWTPLYDQVATVAWPWHERTLGLKFGGTREPSRIDLPTFERLAAKCGGGRRETIALVEEAVSRFRVVWAEHSAGWPLPPDHREAIRAQWSRIPLLRKAGALA